ncbi:A disintegrin and metalloproteinase with thrombospondin motifs 1-like [Ixodes scapularis]|uniref:A disintegrin and metalloproteinase with thrombospondin motifs 1-like n=1 Tax=Ixodes scapularis TaxID=6945 RepID=UPI001A9F9627|nr:A disintegrin and metalloproteinase with thrombospondin motifs 1-like [Ixodes scapularis]
MQLALFMFMMTFTYLSCEEQSDYIPDVYEQLNYLSEDCKENLINQAEQKCMLSISHKLIQFKECQFKCGSTGTSAGLKLTSSQTFRLKDGTPCGHRRVCIKGQCVNTCQMTFV